MPGSWAFSVSWQAGPSLGLGLYSWDWSTHFTSGVVWVARPRGRGWVLFKASYGPGVLVGCVTQEQKWNTSNRALGGFVEEKRGRVCAQHSPDMKAGLIIHPFDAALCHGPLSAAEESLTFGEAIKRRPNSLLLSSPGAFNKGGKWRASVSMKGAQKQLGILCSWWPERPASDKLLPRLRAARCGRGGPDSGGRGGHPFMPTPGTGRLSQGGVWEGCSQGHWQCQVSKTQKSRVHLWWVHRVRRRPPDPPTRASQAAIDWNVSKDESWHRLHKVSCVFILPILSRVGMPRGRF